MKYPLVLYDTACSAPGSSGMVITKFMCAIFSLFVCAEVQFTIYCAKCSANQQTSHGQTFYAKNLGRRIKKESKNDLRCIKNLLVRWC